LAEAAGEIPRVQWGILWVKISESAKGLWV
jgi:hypothetical protein